MNIRTGDVHLTIVQGGLGRKPEPAETNAPKVPAAERFAAAIDRISNVERWEATAVIDRLEAKLGRDIEEDEVEALIAAVSGIKIDYESLTRTLAGASTMFPMPDTETGILGAYLEFEHDTDEISWREHYERNLAEARRRSA